jgi:hypothetical protein
MNTAESSTLDDMQDRLVVGTSAADFGRSARGNSVRNAIAITEMEGGEQLGLFEAGEISVTEMCDRVVRNASRCRGSDVEHRT